MFQKSPVRSLARRKKIEKVRFVFVVTQDIYNMFAHLMDKRSELYASQIFSDVVRFAYQHGVYDERSYAGKEMVSSDSIIASKKPNPKEREEWCTKFGGEMNGGLCKYTKYEITPTGHIVKAQQSLPVKQMPDSEDEFRKFLLGKFGTVGQAESAYQAQTRSLEVPKERTIGEKMKETSRPVVD